MDDLTDMQRGVFEFVRDQLNDSRPAPTVREIAAHFGWSSKRAAEEHLHALIRKGWLLSEPHKARSLRLAAPPRPPSRVVEVPMLGSIPAGIARGREQESEQCIPVTIESIGFKPSKNAFALRVTGDSMIGRHICDGDIVLLEHGAEPRDGQIVAALVDGKSTLKTFVRKNGKAYLKAENPKYATTTPAEELVIQGVFRALLRKSA